MIRPQSFIEYFETYPILIQAIWVLVVILFFSILSLALFLKGVRVNLRGKEHFFSSYQKKIEAYLIEYVYHQNERNSNDKHKKIFPKEIIKGLSSRLKRKVILSTMIKLKAEVSGEMSAPIQKLFQETKLFDFAKNKLDSDKWHIVALGIKTLSTFKVFSVSNEVMRHVNHKRVEVRREAQLYFVNLFEFKGLDFLNKINGSLSEWDQIQLLTVLNKFEDQKITGVKGWLGSSNTSVILFALKLCRIYNLFEFRDSVLELLFHKDKEVNIEVIKLLSYFQVSEATSILKKEYSRMSVDERLVFFKMLEKSPVKEDLSFVLKHIYDINFQIKVSALKVLKIIDIEKFNSIKKTKLNQKDQQIIDFVYYN